jgi:hypothetical protein
VTVAPFGIGGTPKGKTDFTTTELALLIYCHPTWDQDFKFRKEGDPRPKIEDWQYERVRKAAPTFADRVGLSTGCGRPWLWRTCW